MRKSPCYHQVKSHLRKGKRVSTFWRGSGLPRRLPLRQKTLLMSTKKKEQIERLVDKEINQKLQKNEFPDIPKIYKKYGVIIEKERRKGVSMDKKIFPLLVKIARVGLWVVGSCEGHLYHPTKWSNAYVYFDASPKQTQMLAKKIKSINSTRVTIFKAKEVSPKRYRLEITTRGRKATDIVINELIKVL